MYRNALRTAEKALSTNVQIEEPKVRGLVKPRAEEPQDSYNPFEYVTNALSNIKDRAEVVRANALVAGEAPAPKGRSNAEAFLEGFGEGISREEYPDLIEEVTDEGILVTTNADHYGLVTRPKPRSSTLEGRKREFISTLMPHALKASEETGLDPRLIIAQAAQETGWGKSAPNNNYFGIKSHGKSGGSQQVTHEYVDGKKVVIRDSFRGYKDAGDSVRGYVEFLKDNPRYSDMLSASDLESQVAALGASGYATDPNYAASVLSIAQSLPMPKRKK